MWLTEVACAAAARRCMVLCVCQAGDDAFVVQMILSITSFDEFKVDTLTRTHSRTYYSRALSASVSC